MDEEHRRSNIFLLASEIFGIFAITLYRNTKASIAWLRTCMNMSTQVCIQVLYIVSVINLMIVTNTFH